MPEFQTIFRLGWRPGEGVFCDAEGLLVGEVALLERSSDGNDDQSWRPRPVTELNRDLSRCYGLPIQIEPKAVGLEAIADALGRGDLAHAQMVALHLRFPNPPDLEKSADDVAILIDLARRLDASGLLKREWDPDLHPRWPQGSQDSIGGQFAPVGSQGGGAASGSASAGAEGDRGGAPKTQQQFAEDTAPAARPSSSPVGSPTSDASNGPSDSSPPSARSNGAVLNDGVYYENGKGAAPLDDIHIDALGAIRAKIVQNALDNVNSTKWSDSFANGNFGPGSNKCNLFVYDMLMRAGASPGLPNGIIHKYPPLPMQWADPDYHIPGWIVLSTHERPQPGDVVAQRISYRNADGHVMIVGPYMDGKPTFIGTGPRHPHVSDGTIEFIPAKLNLGPPNLAAGPLVFRRYVGGIIESEIR